MKPGFKTSEFFITVSTLGGLLWAYVQQNCDLSPEKLIALMLSMATVAGAYVGGRSFLKWKAKK